MKTHVLLLAKKLCAGLFLFGSVSSHAQVLLAGTSFEPSRGNESRTYISIDDIVQYGLHPGRFTLGAPIALNVNANTFNGSFQYAITNNPHKLDTTRYANISSPDYQIVFSPAATTSNLLEYILDGIAPRTTITVNVSYCSAVSSSYATCGPGEVTSLSGVMNPDQYNLLGGIESPLAKMGQCSTFTFTNSSANSTPIGADGRAVIRFNSKRMGACKAIAITKIEIFGTPKPVVNLQEEFSGCAGDFISLRTGEYQGSSYQWQIRENNAWVDIPSATQKLLYYQTSTAKQHLFRVRVAVPEGSSFYSDSLGVDVRDCCGGPTTGNTLQTIFKDDFGRVDLSDKTGTTYKVWDYLTDPLNPVEVTKTTTTPFRWPINPAPLGAVFVGATGASPARQAVPIQDGEYTVASYITAYQPHGGYDGALLGWAAYVTGPTLAPVISYDHSGKIEGAALFINCPPNTKDQVLYSRTINTLCAINKPLLFECWIAVFTQNAISATYNGVDVNVRLTELNDPTNTVVVNGKASRQADGGGVWVKIAGQINLTGNAVRMDLINNQAVSVNGNDLVIDDIKLTMCSTPQPEAFFNATTLSKTDTLCDEPFKLELLETESMKNYYNNQPYFLHQYSKTPADLASWKNLGTPSSQSNAVVMGSSLVGMTNGDKVYFRTVVATAATFANKHNFQGAGNFANANDACKNYSVSAPISALWINSVKCSFTTDLRSSPETETFQVYPNPVKDLLMLGDQAASAQLYNAMGQLVLQSTASQLQVGYLQAGLYQVTVQLKNGKTVTQKVVKE